MLLKGKISYYRRVSPPFQPDKLILDCCQYTTENCRVEDFFLKFPYFGKNIFTDLLSRTSIFYHISKYRQPNCHCRSYHSLLREAANFINKDHEIPMTAPPHASPLIDTHCHLDMSQYDGELEDIINRANTGNVAGIVSIGIDVSSSLANITIARRFSCVKATVGIHPHDADKVTERELADLIELARAHQDEVVAIGEIGLDYFKAYSKPEIQRDVFRKQLRIAKQLDLPVVIHDRDAHQDCFTIVKEEGPFPRGGIMHCFTGALHWARRFIDENFALSVGGITTFPNAKTVREIATHIPLQSLLLETDGPFLAPVPYRGKRNEPAYLVEIAALVAKLRNISIATLAHATTRNAQRIFNCRFTAPSEETS
jgi:TatD DNase family protein